MQIDILMDEIELRVKKGPYIYSQLTFAEKKH